MRLSSTALLATLFSTPLLADFTCSKRDPSCLGSFYASNKDVLGTFLGDHDTVITQDDVVDRMSGNGTASCAAMTVLFARGTDEPGNVGILAGPAFFAAIAAYMNGTAKLAVQGVDYTADTAGFLAGGSASGATAMAALVNQTYAACPNTLLTLSGYSQGAQLVHNVMPTLPASTTAKIASVVLFGDPKNGTAIANIDNAKVRTICHAKDDICKGGDGVGIAHLTYSLNALAAADWVVNGAGMANLGISSARVITQALGLGG